MSHWADYALHLADNALILGQRNAEWCGHGPILEEDLALANQSLDLIGQARLLYQWVASLRNDGSTEDSLAYFRDQDAFLNFTLLELPHSTAMAPSARVERDYAVTIVRNFFFSGYMWLVWEVLQHHEQPQLAAIASKSLKEVQYHWQHSVDWMLKLGDGTPTSHGKVQAALDFLMPYTQEFWLEWSASEHALPNIAHLKDQWTQRVSQVVREAGLRMSDANGYVTQGIHGIHSEHMSYLLADMQSLARQFPDAQW